MNKIWNSSIIVRTVIVGTVMAIVVSGFSSAVGAGLMLGLLMGAVRQQLQETVFGSILGSGQLNHFFFAIYFIGSFGMLAIPLYIGSVYPDLVNVFGAAFGLLLHKIMIYVEAFFSKRKER